MRKVSSKAIVRRPLGVGHAVFFWRVSLVPILAGMAFLVWAYPVATVSVLAALALATKYELVQRERKAKSGLAMLAGRRPGGSICHFAREFDCRAVDTWIVRAVYETLQDELEPYHAAFPLCAGDRLVEDLGIDPEDLDLGVVPSIAERSVRTLDNLDRNPLYGHVVTVGDLVRFFQAQPRAEVPNAPLCTPANG